MLTFTKHAGKSRVETQVVCYRGSQENPGWVDVDTSLEPFPKFLFLKITHVPQANFTILCTLVADPTSP